MQSKKRTTKGPVSIWVDSVIGRKDDREIRTFQNYGFRPYTAYRTGRAFSIVGVTAAGLFLFGLGSRYFLRGLLNPLVWNFVPFLYLLLGGWVVGVGIYALRLHVLMARTSPVDKVCSKLGIEEELLKTIAEERGIKPQYNVDGHDYYNLAEFKDVGSLLRASQQPTAPRETLLRPAANTKTSPETLLRAENTAPQVIIVETKS